MCLLCRLTLAPNKRRPSPPAPPRHALRARGEGSRLRFLACVVVFLGLVLALAAPAASAALNAALTADDVRQRILNAGGEPVASTPAGYAEVIDREEKMWSALIKSIGLKIEK